MKLLREYIRELLTEVTSLPKEYFSTIDDAISSSSFWKKPNPQDDIDIYSSKAGSVMGTPASEALSKALEIAMDDIGLEIDILVRSHDTDDLEGLTLHPTHPAWPDRWLIDAKWYVSSQRKGRNTIDIEIMTSEPEDDILSSLKPEALVRHIAQTIRHELVHYEQMKKQAASKGLSDTDTFAEMLADPSQVPPTDLKNKEWQRKYLQSHIEIDAHAHDGAEELLAVYNDKEIKDILRGRIDFGDARMPNAILHYYKILGAKNKATQKFMSKLYTQVKKLQ